MANNIIDICPELAAEGRAAELKSRIEKLLGEILSDKYDCIVKVKFEKEATK